MLVIILTFVSFAYGQKPTPTVTGPEKVSQFIKKSPHKFKLVEKNIWTVTDGETTAIVTADAEYVIAFAILAQKGGYKVTSESMSEMLKYAGQADFIKIVIDDGGDLALKIEAKPRGLDQKDFDEMVGQVLAATAEASAKLAPFLVK
ncbi:MAG: hypothetical protein WBO10_13900 [Pyrinomonadaceae bacterium]